MAIVIWVYLQSLPNQLFCVSQTHNTNKDKGVERETSFATSIFHFNGSNNPDPDNSIYKSNAELVLAMINSTM